MSQVKNCPVFGMYAASRKLVKMYSKRLEKLNLTYPQYLALLCIQAEDECSVDDIGKELFLDSGTLTPLLKRLEAMDLIIRKRSSEDERRRVIKLTAAGKGLQSSFDEIRKDVRDEIGMSKDEVHDLKRYLKKILA